MVRVACATLKRDLQALVVWLAFSVLALYEAAHLVLEALLPVKEPREGCRKCVVVPTKGITPEKARRLVGMVDVAVVDDELDEATLRGFGIRALRNRYAGKSGAIATALEVMDCDLYIFIDDDVRPGEWIHHLSSCGEASTAYRWIESPIANMFSLGGLDWLIIPSTRFLWGGAMAIPGRYKHEAIRALLRCPIDDMALSRIFRRPRLIRRLVVTDPPEGFARFALRQALSAKWANRRLWAVETAYYGLWTTAVFWGLAANEPLSTVLMAIHMLRTFLRSMRAGSPSLLQVALSPLERPLQFVVFAIAGLKRCMWWKNGKICDVTC